MSSPRNKRKPSSELSERRRSLFSSLSALLGAVTGSTAARHCWDGFTGRFQNQAKEKEPSAPVRFLLCSLKIEDAFGRAIARKS